MRVLIVEDEARMATAIRRGLQAEGVVADVAARGEDALWMAGSTDFDAVILDVMLPGIDGFETCQRLRDDGVWVPIIMLTARDAIEDRVEGLDRGADDYLVKPFSMGALVASVSAAVRRGVRAQSPNRGETIQVEELTIDPANVQAYVDGVTADLTPTEFRLLHTLALERGRVVTREELMQRIWGRRQRYRDRTVDVFVRKLRTKIDRDAPRHTFIHTRHGVGYKLEAQAK